MHSLKQLLGDRFFELLETSAEQACQSVRLLSELGRPDCPNEQAFSVVRQKNREITAEIETKLAHTAMVSLKKEDILLLSNALARIPEAAERLAQRWILTRDKLEDLDPVPFEETLLRMAETLLQMVRQIRIFDNEVQTRQLHAQLAGNSEVADKIADGIVEGLVHRVQDPTKAVMAKDILDRLSALADLCAECGDLVHEIVLKYG